MSEDERTRVLEAYATWGGGSTRLVEQLLDMKVFDLGGDPRRWTWEDCVEILFELYPYVHAATVSPLEIDAICPAFAELFEFLADEQPERADEYRSLGSKVLGAEHEFVEEMSGSDQSDGGMWWSDGFPDDDDAADIAGCRCPRCRPADITMAVPLGRRDGGPDVDTSPRGVTLWIVLLSMTLRFRGPAAVPAEAERLAGSAGLTAMLDASWRDDSSLVGDVLDAIGRHHPDKAIAKAARTAAHKHRSR